MSPQRVKQLLAARPFQPFAVYTGDGSEVDVLSPDFAYLHPGGRTLLVARPLKRRAANEEDFEEHHIDVFLIAKVTAPIAAGRSNGKRRSHGR